MRRAGGAGRGGGWNCCAASAQRTVLLRCVLGCNDAGGAAALRAGSCAAGDSTEAGSCSAGNSTALAAEGGGVEGLEIALPSSMI